MVPFGLPQVLGVLIVLIPVTGITLAFVAKALARVRTDAEPPAEIEKLTEQIALLQEEVESLSHELKELKAAQDFDRKLLGKEASR